MMLAPFFYIFSVLFFPQDQPKTNSPKVTQTSNALLLNTTSNIKYIYLTFDDGPLFGTSNCIDICLQEKVPATFFQVGMHQARSKYGKDLYKRILQYPNEFEILNHSYTHANGKYLNFYHHPDSALLDMMKANTTLQLNTHIARLPGNSAWNTLNLKKASNLVKPLVLKLDSVGYNIIGWDTEWSFNKHGKPSFSAESMVNLVDSTLTENHTMTPNHVVILMHDHMFRTPADSIKLTNMIRLLKEHPNYEFRKISQYPGLINGGR